MEGWKQVLFGSVSTGHPHYSVSVQRDLTYDQTKPSSGRPESQSLQPI
jgi:hypothetical protein